MSFPGATPQDIENLKKIADWAKNTARAEYSDAQTWPTLAHDPTANKEPIEALVDAFEQGATKNGGGRGIMRSMYNSYKGPKNPVKAIEEDLDSRFHFTSFKNAAAATDAALVKGEGVYSCAIRFSLNEGHQTTDDIDHNKRTLAPHMLQAQQNTVENFGQAQVMPFIWVSETVPEAVSEEWGSVNRMMGQLYADTSFYAQYSNRDIGLLPDGTIVFVDAGCIVDGIEVKYLVENELIDPAEEEQLLEESMQKIQQRSEEWGLDEVFKPMNADGTRKQHEFFPMPDFPSDDLTAEPS